MLFIIIAAIGCADLFAQSVNLSGTVKNAGAVAINGVQVKLKNHPLISASTNASGSFTLIGSTGIDYPATDKPVSFRGNGQVILHLTNLPVRIDIYNVAGQLVANILDVSSLTGDYQVNSAAYVAPDYAIYIVRVIAGSSYESRKFIAVPGYNSKGLLVETSKEEVMPLKSEITAVDSLILEHADYVTRKVGISNYVANLGVITMEAKTLAPVAPGNLSAVAASSTQINLSWNDYSSNESGFKIERAPGGTTGFTQIATVGAGVTIYQNTGLTASTSYAYRIRAYNFVGNSSYSNIATTSTLAPAVTVPAAPTSLTASVISSSQINLGWTDNSTNETLFRIERAPGGTTNFVEITTVGANVSTFQNTGLSSSTSYAYRVCAYNTAGNSAYSNVITISTPAMDYSFPGGTLADLKLVSPSLIFNNLTIAGKLSIPSNESNVTLAVNNLDVNAQVVVTWPTCSPYYDGPNLTVNSTGTVNVNSPINLSGMLAKDQTSTSTCNSCYGPDGGDLTINAPAINMYNYVQTYGGQGARYYNSIGSYYDGCSGGPGGNITLNATNTLTVNATAADFDFYGGSGGYATGIGLNGAKGADGILNFEGATITIAEIGGDLNMYKYNAQNLDYEIMTVNGTLSKGEESAHRNGYDTYYIDYGGGIIDWLEDLYVVYLPTAGVLKVSTTATNGLADLDLFVVNYAFSSIIGQSNGSGSSESITTNILSAGKYIIAVSFSDDCANNVSTNYTLKFNQ